MLHHLRLWIDCRIGNALIARRITLEQADDAFDRVAYWFARLSGVRR